jgi:integrase
MTFSQAAPLWLEVHSPYIATRTRFDYGQYIAALDKFFGLMALGDIGIGNIRAYHKERLLPPGVLKLEGKAGACRVRMESSTLRQILEEAGCWKAIAPLYKHPPLSRREKDGAGQSFTLEQEDTFVAVGLRLPRCELAAHAANVMFKSGFGFGELRNVLRGEFDIEQRTVTITGGAKNDGERVRMVPLTDSAFRSMMWILCRWQELGGATPDQYLIPARGPDLSKPMSSLQGGWEAILRECLKRKLLPEGFKRRIYDCRVTAITKGLSSGKMSEHTAIKLFGQVSKTMRRRYYKPQMEVLREAVELLDPERKKPVSAAPVEILEKAAKA